MRFLFLAMSIMAVLNNQGLDALVKTNEKGKANQMAESLIPGVYAAALTPMNEDFSCNCEALVDHCNDLMHRGCKGIVLFGTTGEATSFSVKEREEVIKKIIKLGMDPKKLIVGISCCAIEDAIQLTSLAVNERCAAVLIVPPFFYKNVSDEGVIDFYRRIIRSINHSELKILLYHIPQFTGVPITVNIAQTLKDEFPDHIIGIKDSEGNLAYTKALLSSFPDLQIFVGNELHISEVVPMGAMGGISGIVNAYPELICSLYNFGKNKQEPDSNEIVQNIVQVIRNYPIFPAIKGIVENQKGSVWHVVRPPLTALSDQQSDTLIKSLEGIFKNSL